VSDDGLRHLLIALAVTTVLVLERLIRAERRRRAIARRPPPDEPVEEHFSASGSIKAVVFAYDSQVMRIEVFQRVANEPAADIFWRRISGPSYVDQGAVPAAVHEALLAAGGDPRGA
jgi:hypothetical protein